MAPLRLTIDDASRPRLALPVTIYSKLGVRGRLELHVFASNHGLGVAAWGAVTS